MQSLSDSCSNLPEWDSFLGYSMVDLLCRLLFNDQPVYNSGVQAMNSGPAIMAFTNIGRSSFFFGSTDNDGYKTMIALSVYCWRKPYNVSVYSLAGDSIGRFFRSCAGNYVGAGRPVVFGHQPAIVQQAYS